MDEALISLKISLSNNPVLLAPIILLLWSVITINGKDSRKKA